MPSSSPWSAQWILDYLKTEKKANQHLTPWLRLANEARAGLQNPSDLHFAITSICKLLDAKLPIASQQCSRKRRRPSAEEDELDDNDDLNFDKRLRAEDENTNITPDNNVSNKLVHRNGNESNNGTSFVVECSQDVVTTQQSITVSEPDLPAKQLGVVCELCKLATLLCQLCCEGRGGISEALDLDVKKISPMHAALVSRLFVGILQLHISPGWSHHIPPDEEVAKVVKKKLINVLTAIQSAPIATSGTRVNEALTGLLKDTLTPDGLADLRSFAHKLCKIYSIFYQTQTNRIQELIAFTGINPEGSTPTSRAMLEKAADLRRNLSRLCDVEVPEGVDEMKELIVRAVNGTVAEAAEEVRTYLRENELSIAWLVSLNLSFGAPGDLEKLLAMLEPHFQHHEKKLQEMQQKKARADALAQQKEQERRQAGIERLQSVRPILDYLRWSEQAAKSKHSKSLNPCIVLGIPFNCVTKPVMKKMKMKVQANLHPDKFNLYWLDEEKRQEVMAEISQAFRVVTEALNDLQKMDSTTIKWLGAGPTKPPPYAAEVGIEWTQPTDARKSAGSNMTTRADLRRRSCPPPQTPNGGQNGDTPIRHAAAETPNGYGNKDTTPAIMPMQTRFGQEAILKEEILSLCFSRKSQVDANMLTPYIISFTAPPLSNCRQGIYEVTVELEPVEKRAKNENRLLYIWIAAPKLTGSQNFKARVIMQYCFSLTSSNHSKVRLQLENVPLMFNSKAVDYEVLYMEVLRPLCSTAGTIHSTLLHTPCVQYNQRFEVPPLREGGVNGYRNALNALYSLSQSDSAYKVALTSFANTVKACGGLSYIKNLRRQEARQLLESVNCDLAVELPRQ